MNNNINIRSIVESDAKGIYETALAGWHYTYKDIFPPKFIDNFVERNYAPEVSLRLLPRVEAGDQFFHVAVQETSVVGFCNITNMTEGMELRRIYLRPEFIGQGIGQALLDEGETFIRAKGIDRYFCFVHQDNELGKRFYAKNGFVHQPQHDQDDEWYMKKQIG